MHLWLVVVCSCAKTLIRETILFVRLPYPIKRKILSTDMALCVASAPHMQEFGARPRFSSSSVRRDAQHMAAWHDFSEHPWLPYTTSGSTPLVDLPTASQSSAYDSLYNSLSPGFVHCCEVLATAGGIANLAAHRYALQHGSAGYGAREEAAASSDLSDLIVRESLVLPDILR